MESQLKEFCESKNIQNAVAVGSSAEGFNIPNSMTIETDSHIDTNCDVDILLLEKGFQISNSLVFRQETNVHATLESCDVHPGYTKVRLYKYNEDNEDISTLKDKVYLNGKQKQGKRFVRFNLQSDKDDEKVILMHGPAVSVEYSTTLNAENISKYGLRTSLDIVLALPVTDWPSEARLWIERSKQSKWLGKEFVDNIVSDGCHVVPVAHKNSHNPDIEWRISFATSEKQIARNAIIDEQRQCYIYFKLLRHLCLKDLDVISSYCLKTVFFYACERIPKPMWEIHTGQCLIYLIDSLVNCVKRKNIPSYFIPENNLVDHIPLENWQALEKRLVQIRKDPISPILKFTDSRMIGKEVIPYVFRENISYVLEDNKKFKIHRDIKRSASYAFLTTSFRMSLLLLNSGKAKESVDILTDSYPTINRYLGPMPLIYYLNNVAILIEDSRLLLLLLQELVAMSNEQSEFECFRENLACAYHAVAYTYHEHSTERNEHLHKAEEIMIGEIHSNGLNSCGVMYGIILMSQKKFQEASNTFESIINEKDEIEQYTLAFGKSEQIFLDTDLQSEIATNGNIEARWVYFAYYFLVKCFDQKDKIPKLSIIFNDFQQICEKSQDTVGFKLLAYSYKQRGEMCKAEKAFLEVSKLCPNDEFILTLITKCNQNMNM